MLEEEGESNNNSSSGNSITKASLSLAFLLVALTHLYNISTGQIFYGNNLYK